MRAVSLDPRAAAPEDLAGMVLAHDAGGVRKGTLLKPEHLERLRGLPEVHVVVMEAGDLHEDEAGPMLAIAIAGPGIKWSAPVQSQIRMEAMHRGLFRVDRAALDEMNALGPVSVFTLVDGQAIEAGEEVAGCKVTPVAVAGAVVAQAQAIARRAAPVVQVVPFRRLRTLVVATEKLKPRARAMFGEAVTRKLGWYGAELLDVAEIERTPAAVAGAYAIAGRRQAELVLFAGASSIDPLDPAYRQLREAGGEVLQQGAPMHPGSMLWLGRLDEATVLGVASCAGFGKNTSLDLVLPFVFAYGKAEAADLRRLGHGGLIEETAGRRFPPYS